MTFLVTLLIALLLFLLGLAVGSFLNVLISRTVEGESWVEGRSRCDHCGQQLVWYDNIPLVSFLWLRGQSRCCQQPIPLSYPLVELMTGLLFVWWYGVGFVFFQLTQAPFSVLQPLFWLLVGVLLVVILVADFLYMLIPDVAVGSLFTLTLVYRLYLVVSGVMQVRDLWLTILGMAVAVTLLGGLWLVTKGKGMGLGDVKYALPMSWLLGWPEILVGLFLAFVSGGLVASLLLLVGKKKIRQKIAFGPFLVLGTVLSLVWGELIFSWYWSW